MECFSFERGLTAIDITVILFGSFTIHSDRKGHESYLTEVTITKF